MNVEGNRETEMRRFQNTKMWRWKGRGGPLPPPSSPPPPHLSAAVISTFFASLLPPLFLSLTCSTPSVFSQGIVEDGGGGGGSGGGSGAPPAGLTTTTVAPIPKISQVNRRAANSKVTATFRGFHATFSLATFAHLLIQIGGESLIWVGYHNLGQLLAQ